LVISKILLIFVMSETISRLPTEYQSTKGGGKTTVRTVYRYNKYRNKYGYSFSNYQTNYTTLWK